jgi:chaperonin GroES
VRIVPLNEKVLVQRLEAEEKTSGGIVLPDAAKEKPKQGKVLNVGEGRRLENGQRVPSRVKKGDRVLFSSYAGTELTIEGEKVLVMSEDDILAIVE